MGTAKVLKFPPQWLGANVPHAPVEVYPEPVRDWSLGFITGHRTRVLLCVGCIFVALAWLWSLFPPGGSPITTGEHVFVSFQYLWLAAVPQALFGLFGLLLYRHPRTLDQVEFTNSPVCFRVVTRGGTNDEAVARTVSSIQQWMDRVPLFSYVVEIVYDQPLDGMVVPALEELRSDQVRTLVVPASYQTPTGVRFKARAHHYAQFHSPITPHTWIFMMDEESRVTSSLVKGIAQFIQYEDGRAILYNEWPRMGQGAITYFGTFARYPRQTLVDMVRTGMDLGHFYLQAKLGISLVGFHGSYVLVRNDALAHVHDGFDCGTASDLAEDAMMALKANQYGIKLAWVEGYLAEQSTFSLTDFKKQRSRWVRGLVRIVYRGPVAWYRRLGLAVVLGFWFMSIVAIPYSIVHLFWGFGTQLWMVNLALFSIATSITMYLVGLWENLREHAAEQGVRRLVCVALFVRQLFSAPVFILLEVWAVVWEAGLKRLFVRDQGFHVVRKT